jgi:F0F1-type ATP synthase gamma subunit
MNNKQLQKKKRRERTKARRKHRNQRVTVPAEVVETAPVEDKSAETLRQIGHNLAILKALEEEYIREHEQRLAAQENATGDNVKELLKDQMKSIIEQQQRKIEQLEIKPQ